MLFLGSLSTCGALGGAPQEEGLSRRSVTAACGSSWTPGRAQTADSKEALGPEHKMFAPKMFTEKKPGHARAPGSVGADAFPTGLSHLSSRYHVCQEDLGGGVRQALLPCLLSIHLPIHPFI